jgi:hypothetical protein
MTLFKSVPLNCFQELLCWASSTYMLYVCKQHASCKENFNKNLGIFTHHSSILLKVFLVLKLVGIEFNVNKISTFFFLLLEGFILKECIWSLELNSMWTRFQHFFVVVGGVYSQGMNVFGVWSFFGFIAWSMNSHVATGIQAQSANKTNEIENCVHVFLCGWLC